MILVLFFFSIILFFIFGLLFSKVKIKFNNVKFNKVNKKINEKEYFISVGLYLFGIIKVLGIYIKKGMLNEKYIRNIKIYNKLKEEVKFEKINKKVLLKNIKKINFKVEEFKLDLELGSEDTIITSFLVYIISNFVSLILRKGIKEYDFKKHKFIITPRYENCNIVNFNFKSIISFKTIDLIKIIINIRKYIKLEKESMRRLLKQKKDYLGYV